ncbi:unknown [Firmicutes bacterium CAG:137]|nr:unknown [Firmicutes bacterium CAG:137]
MLPSDGGEGLILEAGALGVDHHVLPYGKILTSHTSIVDGGHAQGVGIGAGRAHHIHAHIVGIQVPGVLGLGYPGAGVACGNGHHHAALGQTVQNGLVFLLIMPGSAGVRGTQGKVDGIALQHNGVLNGHQIVRFIGAAVLAEHLHGNELGVRSHTLDLHRVQSIGKRPVSVGDVGIGRRDAGHMGAVFTLLVPVMGDV